MRSVAAALATLTAFGCQTVQVPARAGPGVDDPPGSPPPRVALAEPQLDLWLEGNGAVPDEEREEGLRAARAALAQALGHRGFVPAADAERILVVRAQGVARTGGRRAAQIGAVAAAVAVVAGIVALAVISGKGGGRARVPAGAPARAVPAVPARAVPGPGAFPAPAPWSRWDIHIDVPLAEPPPAPPAEVPPPAPTLAARLPSRGFFDGDETEIALELRDLRSGALLWFRAAGDRVDPRDPAAVRALLDRALAGEPWAAPLLAPAGAPPPPRSPTVNAALAGEGL